MAIAVTAYFRDGRAEVFTGRQWSEAMDKAEAAAPAVIVDGVGTRFICISGEWVSIPQSWASEGERREQQLRFPAG